MRSRIAVLLAAGVLLTAAAGCGPRETDKGEYGTGTEANPGGATGKPPATREGTGTGSGQGVGSSLNSSGTGR